MEFIREDCIYARQSVDRKDSISIESQIDFCKYELKGGSCRVFKDKGYSGKNTQLCRGKTLLVIAHRLNTIRHADEILVIDQGRIVQAGDHDKLMAEEGIYRRFITARSNPTGWCR